MLRSLRRETKRLLTQPFRLSQTASSQGPVLHLTNNDVATLTDTERADKPGRSHQTRTEKCATDVRRGNRNRKRASNPPRSTGTRDPLAGHETSLEPSIKVSDAVMQHMTSEIAVKTADDDLFDIDCTSADAIASFLSRDGLAYSTTELHERPFAGAFYDDALTEPFQLVPTRLRTYPL